MSAIFPSEEKKQLLVNLLLAMGCTKVQVHFAGSGDSGSIEDIHVMDKDEAEIDVSHVELEWEQEASELDPIKNEWGKVRKVSMLSLHDILKQITEDALEQTGHDWYNNDGGQGNLYIYPTETPVRIELDVGINYMETEHHLHDFTEEISEDEEGEPTEYADLDAEDKARKELLTMIGGKLNAPISPQ